MVPGLMGLRAAKPLAITTLRHLQGWGMGWMPVLTSSLSWGSPCFSLQQQHEGMLTVTKSPQHLAEPAACGTNSGKVQGGVSHAQPAALAHSSCPRVQTLALKGPQETSLSN